MQLKVWWLQWRYITLCTKCRVGRLMMKINENESSAAGSTPPLTKPWTVGADCLALREDGNWYRARITDISDDLYRVTLGHLYVLSRSFLFCCAPSDWYTCALYSQRLSRWTWVCQLPSWCYYTFMLEACTWFGLMVVMLTRPQSLRPRHL